MTTRFVGNGVGFPIYAANTDPSSQTDGSQWLWAQAGAVRWRINAANQDRPNSPQTFNNLLNATASWFKPGQAGTVSAATPTDGTAWFMPFWPTRRCTIVRLAYEVTTQGISAAGTDRMRFGLYNTPSTTGQEWGPPDSLLIDFGDVDLEVAPAVYTLNVTDQAINPRLYWICVARQTTGTIAIAAQVRMQVPAQQNQGIVYQSTAGTPTIGATDGGSLGYYSRTGVTGALPDPASTVTPVSTAAPIVMVEITTPL